ncbi:MAG: hypothetical protein K9K30_09270 [Burkholderiaceae bacterium]|nr:hypothetical protein [Sulfuritalea sp.]MCF8175415.1 hypothetical protein [Burkholderiaceae bacterium]MCF8184378.1 hypothetical protein [Polynucleobacter sp.]
MFELLSLIFQNVHLWEVTLLVVVVWAGRHPEHLKLIQSIKIGDMEIKLKQLEAQVSNSKTEMQEQIHELEQEIEGEKRLFGDLLQGFDVHSPLHELAKTRDLLKSNARTLSDFENLGSYLEKGASAEELYAAAVTLRERRPTQLFDKLVQCLQRLSSDENFSGIRLNTVWTLTSAVHLMLISAIRDGVEPSISSSSLREAKQVLSILEQHPRVQTDRPDKPEKGIRGPIKHAISWIEKGLN